MFDRANCISRVGRVIAYGAWRREVMFMHFIRLNSSLLSKKICSALDVKSRLSRQRILSQLETAAQCLTYSMCQFEAPGSASLLKLLATDLWTLLWTILLMHLTRLSSPLLSKKICSVLNVKSRLTVKRRPKVIYWKLSWERWGNMQQCRNILQYR